jgi:hypothetical protein
VQASIDESTKTLRSVVKKSIVDPIKYIGWQRKVQFSLLESAKKSTKYIRRVSA